MKFQYKQGDIVISTIEVTVTPANKGIETVLKNTLTAQYGDFADELRDLTTASVVLIGAPATTKAPTTKPAPRRRR